MSELSLIKNFLANKNHNLLNLYLYGSKVYGYKNPTDLDYIAIVKEDIKKIQYNLSNRDITVYSKKEFSILVKEHNVLALETLFSSKEFILEKKLDLKLKIDQNKLRESFSQKSSHSWVKAKKKITVRDNLYIGQKSLFHSLRILDYAIQLAKYQKITNFQVSNHYWEKIVQLKDWESLNKKFKPIYNEKKSQLRLLCPKV